MKDCPDDCIALELRRAHEEPRCAAYDVVITVSMLSREPALLRCSECRARGRDEAQLARLMTGAKAT